MLKPSIFPFLFYIFLSCGGDSETIDLRRPASTGMFYATAHDLIPDSLGVLETYELRLPEYTKGIYYAQDNYYDYWQVNGNRVLPWLFTRETLTELFERPAYGVDDEAAPAYKSVALNGRTRYVSRYGVFLQLELADGRYMAVLPLASPDAVSWFHVGENGRLCVELATYGRQEIDSKVPVAAWAVAENLNRANLMLYQSLRNVEPYDSTFRLRYEKEYPEPFKYLGWCTWEEYKKRIDARLLEQEIAKLKAMDLPVRYAVIDDGHLSFVNGTNETKQRLSSFSPNAKFPDGFGPLLSMRGRKLKWMGLWHNFNGYWGGFSPENDFEPEVNASLRTIPETGFTVPKAGMQHIRRVYESFLRRSAEDGFDFLKVDWQAANLYMLRFSENAARQSFLTSRTVDDIARERFGNAMINCMAMNNVVLLNTRNVNVTRTSIDYKLNNTFMAKEHLLQSYHNALYMCPVVWGDHDMFHSCDTVCGEIMALSKAVSGGPIYLSDAPEHIIPDMVRPLCYDDGALLRPLAPATVMQRSAFSSPLVDGSVYYVSAPLDNRAAVVTAYNLSVDSLRVAGSVSPRDYAEAGTLLQPEAREWEIPEEGLFVYDYFGAEGRIVDDLYGFEIQNFGHKYLLMLPVYEGWAVVGRTDKYLAPATVGNIEYTTGSLRFAMTESGPVTFWSGRGTPRAEGMEMTSLGNGLWRVEMEKGVQNLRITITRE